jgi:hypothetical protein
MENGTFVFVVCGDKEYIDTLHFSLRTLRFFSAHKILVVTDTRRNAVPVVHEHILDIETPAYLNNHQASIYLKTGLHKFLTRGQLYCYLDTDVVALDSGVNEIFKHKKNIITFASDHCRMPVFSPYAVNCGCLERNRAEWEQLSSMLLRLDKSPAISNPYLIKKQRDLKKKLELVKQNRFRYFMYAVKYFMPGQILKLDENTSYNKESGVWYDTVGNPIMYDTPKNVIAEIEKTSEWRWNYLKRRWISPQGANVHELSCAHLKENIQVKFKQDIKHPNWQHWNGGVFLFDDASHPFMDTWHLKTLEVFKDPKWKTRDQGTLIATAWEFGLQDAPLLSKKFNFIADPSNPRLMISEDRVYITDDAFATQYAPSFIHLFHNFGMKGWEVWDWVEGILEPVLKPEHGSA